MLDQDFDKLLEVFLAVPHCYLVSLGRSNLDDARNFQKLVEMLAKLENLFAGFGHPKHQRQPPLLVDQDQGHDLGASPQYSKRHALTEALETDIES